MEWTKSWTTHGVKLWKNLSHAIRIQISKSSLPSTVYFVDEYFCIFLQQNVSFQHK